MYKMKVKINMKIFSSQFIVSNVPGEIHLSHLKGQVLKNAQISGIKSALELSYICFSPRISSYLGLN